MSKHLTSIGSESPNHDPPKIRAPRQGLGTVSMVALLIGALLWGLGYQPFAIVTYLHPWAAGIPANQPLDLTRPVFVKGTLCPSGGLLALYSVANSQGCLVASSTKPVTVFASAVNGRQDRVFEVDIVTDEGAIEGWVRSDDLRN